MKIFSFRKIYALHFLSQVDYVRSFELPFHRSEAIYSLPRSSLKRSLAHVRLRHRSDIAGMNQKFYQTSPGFRTKFQGDISSTLWVSNPFTHNICAILIRKILYNSCARNGTKRPLRKNSFVNCTCTLQHSFPIYLLILFIFIFYLIFKSAWPYPIDLIKNE